MTENDISPTADELSDDSRFSRRSVLKAVGTGAVAAGVGSGVMGTSTAATQGIPTPKLTVDGNLIKDPQGEKVKLRGVNIADPKRLNVTAPARGKNAEQVIDLITDESKGWYSRVIRIPVQPTDIGEHPPGPVAEDDPAPPVPAFDQSQLESYLETHLDPVVQQCKENNVYCIVDYHRHWKGVQWGDQQGINTNLQKAVLDFWKTVAPRYGDMDHVFFEVYNEPTKMGMYGPRDKKWVQNVWKNWKKLAQPWVDEVRAHSDNLVIVGSPGWSQTPEGASMIEEFDGKNLSYAYHTYGGHAANRSNSWEDKGGSDYSGMQQAFEKVPVFVTEFGWQDNFPGYAPHRWIQGTTDGFGAPLLDILESHDGIHWTAWCADPIWLPAMFKRGFETPDTVDSVGNPYEGEMPTHCKELPCKWELRGGQDMGQLIKDTMAANKDNGIPSGDIGNSGDTTPPSMPSNLSTAEATDASIQLSWDSASDSGGTGVDSYRVYVDGTVKTSTTDTSATVSDLEADTSYELGVKAVDGAGNTSDLATTTASTTGETTTTTPDGDVTVSVELSSNTATPDSTVEASLVLSEAPEGLSGYTIDAAVADTSVATISGASYPDVFGLTEPADVAADGSSVTLKAVDVQDEITAGAENVELATVSLSAEAKGSTDVGVVVDAMDTDGGQLVEPATTAGTLTISSSEAPTVNGVTVQDPDGDGKYEDLNANGRVDADDVVIYFEHKDGAISDNVAAFDFNDNGRIDFDDVAALFDEV